MERIKNKVGRPRSGTGFICPAGYFIVPAYGHSNVCANGWAKKHRIIMSDYLGRSLTRDELVHHKNGNRLDNRLENLEITDRGNHMRIHNTIKLPIGKIMRQYKSGIVMTKLAKKFNVSFSTIQRRVSEYLKEYGPD